MIPHSPKLFCAYNYTIVCKKLQWYNNIQFKKFMASEGNEMEYEQAALQASKTKI